MERGSAPSIAPLSQLVTRGELGELPLLPSVLFCPPPGEALLDPFGDAPWMIGAHARARAQRAPGRAITSPKSWLCHPRVDRLGPILPWGDVDDPSLARISPVEASRRILSHVKSVLGQRLDDAQVVLTVPASFDEVARELTVRAADEVGLRVRLLEEPVAAFYDHLARAGTDALEAALDPSSGRALVLVCDVGGGTTDLTLVSVTRIAGELRFDRIAVGRHLLLGGDNMDLALAHALEPDLVAPPNRLSSSSFAELVLACRDAKELLLAPASPDEVPIRILGAGSQLVGSTRTASLSRERVRDLVLDGFFPAEGLAAAPPRERAALVGFGLPYERDPAITRHIAAFLARHSSFGAPALLLLNGGVFHAPEVRERVVVTIATITGTRPVELDAREPDLAVARGAALFGASLWGFGPHVGGGSARGYYLGLSLGAGSRRLVCVVPRGSREGERHVVRVPGLALVVGAPVRFDSYASDAATHAPGEIVEADPSFDALPSMTASFEHGPVRSGSVPVHLEGELTPVGTLDVACVAEAEGAPRFRLAFELRAQEERRASIPPTSSRAPQARLSAAEEAVGRALGGDPLATDPRGARQLLRDLERILGERATWTTETARALFDVLAPLARFRRRSVDHERAFWLLSGYCLRPGYGHPLDEKRVGKLVPLFGEFVAHADESRVWQQFFIAWRRVSGGLGEPLQTAIRDAIDPFLSTDPDKPKKKKGLRPQALDEMLELAASLERVPAARRAALGRWILEKTWSSRDPRLWAALGRVGARAPAYASAHYVVPTSVVTTWLDHLLREKWSEVPTAPRAALQIARVTGDRARDLSESLRKEVARRMVAVSAPPEWVRAVTELVPLESADRAEFFGEGLPLGLVLPDA